MEDSFSCQYSTTQWRLCFVCCTSVAQTFLVCVQQKGKEEGPKATKAHMGDKNAFYYDEQVATVYSAGRHAL